MGRDVELVGDGLSLSVDLDHGAKVTSLRCTHGREWLAQPDAALPASPAGAFGARESWGWDELFPTVLPGPGAPPPWTAPLRDHGELWGRPWEQLDATSSRLAARFGDPRFEFTRALSVSGARLQAGYQVRNRTSEPLPFLWAMHPILALAPGERVVVPTGPEPFELRVAEPDGRTVLKLYPEPVGPLLAAVEGGCCRLTMRAAPGAPIAAVGLYVNYGGWPEPGSPLHQVGVEPTTAGADDLAAAVAREAAVSVGPGGELAWAVELSVEP